MLKNSFKLLEQSRRDSSLKFMILQKLFSKTLFYFLEKKNIFESLKESSFLSSKT